MSKQATITIERAGTTVHVNLENGQLFRLLREGPRGRIDLFWQGGAPETLRPKNGWQNSEIIMFPIVGKAPGPNNTIVIDGESFSMSQHGLSRLLPWKASFDPANSSLRLVQEYEAGQKLKNAKDEVPETTYTYLYIRRPDPYRAQAGDIDFYLEPKSYGKLKQELLDGKKIKGMRVMDRKDLDMIELYDPDVDVLAYVSTNDMAERVRVKLSDATKL